MNNRGQLGLVFLIVFFVIALVLFSIIDPFKEQLDVNRGGDALNCPSAPDFDQVDYENDTEFERLVRRPTCFVTGISLVWFVGAVLIAGVGWVVTNWKRVSI